MYNAEFLDAAGHVQERVVLGVWTTPMEADNEAKRIFEGVRARHPSVVGYRVLNNDGKQVAQFRAVHA